MRVGVIGVGALGRHHARVYASLPGCSFVGVSDVDERRGSEVAGEFDVEYFRHYGDLVQHVEGVSVCVPTEFHHPIAKDVLGGGVHCLLEKPITAELEQADELVDIAHRKSLVLQIGHIERFNPGIRAVEGLIKNPLFIESHRLSPFTARGTDVAVVLDLMIHDIDMVLHFTEGEVDRVEGVGVPVLSDQEDIANARIELSTGCIANLTTSRVSREKLRKIRFFQRDAYISVDYLNREVEVYERVSKREKPFIRRVRVETSQEEPLSVELQSFVDSVRNGTPPLVSGEQGRKALKVALRIQEEMRRRRQIVQKGRPSSL
jgi:predicted dehydrogenase